MLAGSKSAKSAALLIPLKVAPESEVVMAERFHFTLARLRALPPAEPGKRQVYYHDSPPELALRVTDSGGKVFYVVKRVGRRMEWLRIGRFPGCGLDAAQRRAKDLLGEVARGGNPGADRRQRSAADVPLRVFLKSFLDDYATPNVSPAVARNWEILIRRHVLQARKSHLPGCWHDAGTSKHGDVRLDMVTQEWLARLQATIAPTPGVPRRRTANQCVALLRRAFAVAAQVWGWKLPHGNPAAHVPLFRDAERDAARTRFLTVEELGRLFKTLSSEAPVPRLVVLLALLSGQRRGNVLSARWDAIDLAAGTWTVRHSPRSGTTTKSRHDHYVVLPALLVGLLRGYRDSQPADATWVFPSPTGEGHVIDFKKPWARIIAGAKLEGFRFHDLRHSAATLLLAAGAPLPVIGRQLGHRSTESTARYAHVQLDGQRAAVAAAAAVLPAKLLTQSTRKRAQGKLSKPGDKR